MIILALLALLAWIYLFFFRARFWRSEPELTPSAPSGAPAGNWSVCIVVPARDEAALIAASIGSLLDQQHRGAVRVILVDDNSTDGTAAIARALADARGSTALTIVDGADRPEFWVGKTWAMQQGFLAAQAYAPDYILFTDADIVHDPRHLATLLSEAERSGTQLVSEMVALHRDSLAERALIPAFVYFFQMLYPFALVNDPARRDAAAAGGTMLAKASALDRIGGISAIKGALIDDVALGTELKRIGTVWLGHTRLARSIRPYPHFADIWRMISRSAYVQLRHSPLLLAGTILGMALVWLAPPLLAIFSHGAAAVLAAFAWALSVWSFLPTLDRYRAWPFWAPALPLIALFYMAATIGSAIDHHAGSGAVWKSRAYGGQK